MSKFKNLIQTNDIKALKPVETINKHVAFILDTDVSHKGCLKFKCKLNESKEVYAIELKNEIENGTNGTFNDIFLFECNESCAILVDCSTPLLEIDDVTGVVVNHITEDIIKEKGKFKIGQSVSISIKNQRERGTITLSGRINGIFCYAVTLDLSEVIEDIPQSCIVIEYDVNALSKSEEYVMVRYTLDAGDKRGIQGNLNSCYLDTSLFAIFTFNMFLDNMLLDENGNPQIEELRDILRAEIVYPLRRYGYVNYKIVSKFRDKLQSLSPAGKFVMNERDPEELFEQLFKLLTPAKYLLRTTPLTDLKNVQNCFLTQLFYQSASEINNTNLRDMLTLTFLEFDMLITLPPKCMIIQLPRDGKELKNFKRVSIPAKLNITPFIMACPKRCKDCSTTDLDVLFCKTCSLKRIELTYFCKDHKLNCAHEKISMPTYSNPYMGDVNLELVSVLCIERNHYVTYVKTNFVTGKWIYFNSMEKIENGIFTPVVRDTKLQEYFSNGSQLRRDHDRDVDKVEEYAFVCIYKNPVLEFYNKDFNSA